MKSVQEDAEGSEDIQGYVKICRVIQEYPRIYKSVDLPG